MRRRVNPLHILFIVVGLALLAGHGCSPMPDFETMDAEETFASGEDAVAQGEYLVAIEAFKKVTMDFPLNALADDALLALADVYREAEDFASAEAEYRRLVSDYPRSRLVAEAEYKLGLTYMDQALPAELDQSMTHTAIRQLERFLEKHPQSELTGEARKKIIELRSRLAEKLYLAARLYVNMQSPEAARTYLRAIARDYPDTAWARRSLLEEARSFSRQGMSIQADEVYLQLIDRYPGTDEARLAEAEKSAG